MERGVYRAVDRALSRALPDDDSRRLVFITLVQEAALAGSLALMPLGGIVGMFAELGAALAGVLLALRYPVTLLVAWGLVKTSRQKAELAARHGGEAAQGQGRPWVLRSRRAALGLLLANLPLWLWLMSWAWGSGAMSALFDSR